MESSDPTAFIAIALVLGIGLPPIVLRLTRSWGGPFLGRHVRGLAIANIVAQGGIIVTGGAVRLTGSGLGCSTWPECEPGQFTPTLTAESGLHPLIEFGNRTLTGVLVVITIALAIALWHTRRELRWWGLVPYAGVLAQAILGGIIVLVHLNPVAVAPHLMLSAALVWNAVWLAMRVRGTATGIAHHKLTVARWASLALLVAVISLGALTTGAGPHSGDADATARLALNPAEVAKYHALSVWAFTASVVWIGAALWRTRDRDDERRARRATVALGAVILAQGGVGYAQYFLNLPVALVALHLLGIAVLMAAHARVFIATAPRAEVS